MRILIFRAGAYGDTIIITPVIRFLHNQGHEIYALVSKRGMEVLKNNPNITELIEHDETTPVDKLAECLEAKQKEYDCHKVIDFSESIEVALSQHPRSPNYKLPKQERFARFNRNFYEYAFEHAKIKGDVINVPKIDYETGRAYSLEVSDLTYHPELFFEEKEVEEAESYLQPGKFNILIGMSGSGSNKAWPYIEPFCLKLVEDYPNIHLITVGDYKCKLIEPEVKGRITNLSGVVSMRVAMALTGAVDLVIAPDTGIIHAAGCYSTPKICLLGHNTIECITKHFENDYSIEADSELAPCSPCLFLIYDMKLQCPLNPETKSSVCMADGITKSMVHSKFKEIYDAQR